MFAIIAIYRDVNLYFIVPLRLPATAWTEIIFKEILRFACKELPREELAGRTREIARSRAKFYMRESHGIQNHNLVSKNRAGIYEIVVIFIREPSEFPISHSIPLGIAGMILSPSFIRITVVNYSTLHPRVHAYS